MKKVLIVEDEIALREVYVTLFTIEKFDVYQAVNGKDALKQLPKIKPDIMLVDVLMPEMGGMEFLQIAPLRDKYPKTKILMLTNLSDTKTLQQIKDLGANYILKSSISPLQLVQAVRELLAS